ncbi:MAG: hypothetical protein ACE5Q3_18710, partial [Alphaproteobacteria bacterium]
GAILVASGLFHLGVFVIDGVSWQGAVSWRKPATFGLSFGITTLAMGWILGLLPTRRVLGWMFAIPYCVAIFIEVALVTMQRWRGVPSHFNKATSFDDAVFSGMGVSIAVVGILTVVLLVWALIELRQPRVVRWAVIAGMVMLLGASAIGKDMIDRGNAHVAAVGEVPSTVIIGDDGSSKAAHAIGLHGVQILGGLAVLLGLGRLAAREQTALMAMAIAGYAGLFGVVTAQTYRGLAPFDLNLPTAAMAAGSLLLLGAAFARAAPAWLIRREVPGRIPAST